MLNKLTIDKIEQISIEMDGTCNLRCPMCPQSWGREEEFLQKMDFNLFKSVIDQAVPHGLKYVILSGSGEPLKNKNLEEAIVYLTELNSTSMIYTNGILLRPKRFESLCKAGLSIIKVSCQGWDRESYTHYMSIDAFDRVRQDLKDDFEILANSDYFTYMQTNHLIQDYDQLDYQLEKYLENWVYYLNCEAEIWLAHNWAGNYAQKEVSRRDKFAGRRRRTCGRPLSPIIEIRAGGLGGKKGAVVPCPYVLGMDSKAVMGHTEDTPLLDIVNGEKFQHLRDVHLREAFDEVDYCKNCDQLLEVEESLVWTNIPNRSYGESRISGIDYLASVKDFIT